MYGMLIDGKDPNFILNIARGFGSADLEIIHNDENEREVNYILGRIHGVRYRIVFYEYRDGSVSLMFSASWRSEGKISLQQVNDWNKRCRFAKAYLDDDMDVGFDMDVELDGGVGKENLEHIFERWTSLLHDFSTSFLGDNDEDDED